jgi:5-methylcytosine-specific restriction endonuclease McrA
MVWNSQRQKYCKTCAQEVQREQATARRRRNGIEPKKESIKSLIDNNIPCEKCGWDKATCDRHHVVPLSAGGDDSPDNIIVLCPNCHRLAHLELDTQQED